MGLEGEEARRARAPHTFTQGRGSLWGWGWVFLDCSEGFLGGGIRGFLGLPWTDQGNPTRRHAHYGGAVLPQ